LPTWRFSQIGACPQIWAWRGAQFSKILGQARGPRPLGAKSRNLDPSPFGPNDRGWAPLTTFLSRGHCPQNFLPHNPPSAA